MTPTCTYRSQSFTADCICGAGDVLLRVSGWMIDSADTAPEWSAALRHLSGRRVRLDLTGVTYMDARGLGLLADLARNARTHGVTISVICANARVGRLLEMTRLSAAFQAQWRPCAA
jgi:anti-anti-sigma factor